MYYKHDGKHLDVHYYLRKKQNFIFLNGIRAKIGKTYTSLWALFTDCLINNVEMIYLFRNQKERDNEKGLYRAFEKIINEQFSEDFEEFEVEKLVITKTQIIYDGRVLVHGIAISEYSKIKKWSFPSVKYIILDEYVIENATARMYSGGNMEVDRVLSIYDTVDRDSDKVKFLFLANNLSMFNIYHLHPVFNITHLNKNKFISSNVYYENIIGELANDTEFRRMTKNSEYGKFASMGEFIEDNYNLIQKLTGIESYKFTIFYNNKYFGISYHEKLQVCIIHDKVVKNNKNIISLSKDGELKNVIVGKKNPFIKWLTMHLKRGGVRFSNMVVKCNIEPILYKLI